MTTRSEGGDAAARPATADSHARLLAETLPLVTYVATRDAPWGVTYISPQVEGLLGFPPAVWTEGEESWLERMVPEDRERFLHALEDLRRVGATTVVEYRMLAADGRVVWVRDTAVLAPDDEGRATVQGFLLDVSREKELESTLAAVQAAGYAFFRESPVGLAIMDAEGRYVAVNDALARMNGIPAADHIGRRPAELSPELARVVEPVMQEMAHDGAGVGQYEGVAEPRPGEPHTYAATSFRIPGPGRSMLGFVVVDITDLRAAEAERAAAQLHYRRLIEQLPLVTYVNELEPVSHAVYVNPQIEELFGYPAERWLAEPELGDRVIHPDDLERVRAAELLSRETGGPFELEYRIVRADGTVRWVLDLMQAVADDDGTVLYEQGFLVDVTGRKESEQLFRAIFEGSLDGIVILDDDGRYVDANPAACAVFGRDPHGLTFRDVGWDEAAEAQLPELRGRAAVHGAIRLTRPDGDVRDIEFAARANVLPGRHLSVLRDVTERKRLERRLFEGQKLESVGRLAGGVAHDFNNMLTAIEGYVHLLRTTLGPGSVEREHVEEIARAAERASKLTGQLLAFGRRQMLQPQPLSLNELVGGLTEVLRRMVGDHIELRVELDPDLPATTADSPQIEQLLLNLVLNGAEAMPEGGRLTIGTAVAERLPEDLPEGVYVALSVADTGSGIDADVMAHLFEPFFTTKEPGRAVGLGLATAYGVARQSGGTIAVETAPGRGATFTVLLPATPAPAP